MEIGWWIFVLLNAAGILVFSDWATIPFHFIWIGLSLLYGWRVWGPRGTYAALAVIIAITGVTLGEDVIAGNQAVDEMTEIPLMSAVFLVMVWYVRHSVATEKMIRRVSARNLALLQQARHFIQDVSHVLRTPLTIALGHAEVLQRTTADAVAAQDAQIVINELKRLKALTDRLLALATSEQPDFVHRVGTAVSDVVTRALDRWSATCSSIIRGPVDDTVFLLDPDRVLEALDEMIGNAVAHTQPGTPIELSARREDGFEVIAVADRGPGIPEHTQSLIFDRFTQVDGASPNGGRRNGFGLGLAIVKAVAEAHGGSAGVRSRVGQGAVFELRLPLRYAEPQFTAVATPPAMQGHAPA